MTIIRTTQTNKKYEYSSYEVGWVFEVINDFGEYYTAKVLTGSKALTDTVVAVHKSDCIELHLGSYESDGPVHMKL